MADKITHLWPTESGQINALTDEVFRLEKAVSAQKSTIDELGLLVAKAVFVLNYKERQIRKYRLWLLSLFVLLIAALMQ